MPGIHFQCLSYLFTMIWHFNPGKMRGYMFINLLTISVLKVIYDKTSITHRPGSYFDILHIRHFGNCTIWKVADSVIPWNMPMGLLPDKQNCGLRMRPGTFSPPPRFSDPDLHHGTCMATCMPGSLISGFLWSWCWGKRSRHSRHMHNPKCCVSGKRPRLGFIHFVSFVFSC